MSPQNISSITEFYCNLKKIVFKTSKRKTNTVLIVIDHYLNKISKKTKYILVDCNCNVRSEGILVMSSSY